MKSLPSSYFLITNILSQASVEYPKALGYLSELDPRAYRLIHDEPVPVADWIQSFNRLFNESFDRLQSQLEDQSVFNELISEARVTAGCLLKGISNALQGRESGRISYQVQHEHAHRMFELYLGLVDGILAGSREGVRQLGSPENIESLASEITAAMTADFTNTSYN